MKTLNTIILLAVLFVTAQSFAQHHDHNHAKHNHIVFGESEIFASHLVYKQPHNYQVILKLNLEAKDQEIYLAARAQFPQDEYVFLLDTMDISKIDSAEEITGPFFRRDSTGKKFELNPNLRIKRDRFQIIYFNELPLSLAK